MSLYFLEDYVAMKNILWPSRYHLNNDSSLSNASKNMDVITFSFKTPINSFISTNLRNYIFSPYDWNFVNFSLKLMSSFMENNRKNLNNNFKQFQIELSFVKIFLLFNYISIFFLFFFLTFNHHSFTLLIICLIIYHAVNVFYLYKFCNFWYFKNKLFIYPFSERFPIR